MSTICTMVRLLLLLLAMSATPASVVMRTKGPMCRPCKNNVDGGCIDCSSLNLTSIPQDLSENITSLNLSMNLIQSIPEGAFERFPNLLVLDLHKNLLTVNNISNTTFEGLTRLKVLNISHNDQMPLTNASTPLGLFESMPELEVLKMYGTTGTYNIHNGYPDKQLSQLQSLKELWIDGLTGMPFGTEFRNMPNLKILRLSGDCIKPSWRSSEFCLTENITNGMLDNLIHITHLYIRKCGIKHVDKDVFRGLDMLEYLDVSLNTDLTLKGISIAFGSLQNRTNTLILDRIEPSEPTSYTVEITTSMVEPLTYLPLRVMSFNGNNIQLVQPHVFELLPKSLENVSANYNNFYGGYYLFYIRYQQGLRYLDISYQSVTSLLSVWQKPMGKKGTVININQGRHSIKSHQDDYSNIANGLDFQSQILSFPNISDYFRYESSVTSNMMINKNKDDEQDYFPHIIESVNRTWMSDRHFRDQIIQQSTANRTCELDVTRYFPPGTITFYLPPNLEYLDMSHCQLATSVLGIFINPNNSLKTLIARNSFLFCWEGPVHGLYKLEVLDVSRNSCNNISKVFFSVFPKLRLLYLNNNYLTKVIRNDTYGEIMRPLKSLQLLDLSFCRIHDLPKLFMNWQTNIVAIKFNTNFLSEFEMGVKHMEKLRYLDLRKNFIKTLSESICEEFETIAKGITSRKDFLLVDIRLNPIDCTCNNIKFLNWLKAHLKGKPHLVVQVSECLFHGNTWRTIHTQTLLGSVIDELENECRSYTELIITLSVCLAVIINVILGVIVHRNRWKLQYWYYVVLDNYKSNLRKHRADYERLDTYLYDVYVASTEDTETKEFCIDKLRAMFKANNICAFVQAYHIEFNDNKIRTIGKAINFSRVIIFVFSDEWADDEMMKIAVHMWQCDMLQRDNTRCAFGINLSKDPLIAKHNKEIQYMAVREIIDYPGDSNEEEEKTFWRECETMITKLKQDETLSSFTSGTTIE